MAKNNNIVHQYFRKELEGEKILVKLNPIHLQGIELTISAKGTEMRELEFDAEIVDDLKADGFAEVNAMEFNLYLAGLI
jgi:Asp-tRNA(Asn)/Glu-tRNA(Gln) amidotransferase A subunit family amidase